MRSVSPVPRLEALDEATPTQGGAPRGPPRLIVPLFALERLLVGASI